MNGVKDKPCKEQFFSTRYLILIYQAVSLGLTPTEKSDLSNISGDASSSFKIKDIYKMLQSYLLVGKVVSLPLKFCCGCCLPLMGRFIPAGATNPRLMPCRTP